MADRLETILVQAKKDRKRLDGSAMGAFSLTTLGIASVVGAGIFVTTGTAAAQYAGPAVVLSFVLAGLAAAFTAICYAELAAMIPIAGSTYSYAYAAFGVFLAWFIGWDLLLEYLFAASTVAVGWSGYLVSFLDSLGIHIPHDLSSPPFGSGSGIVNLPAILVVAGTTALLVVGTRQSAGVNNAIVALKIVVLLLFVAVGAFAVDSSNWTPFVPANDGDFGDFGASGVIRGAGVVFFAYVGFDAVSTAAGEARNPQRTVPIGLLGTVLISTVLYVAIGLVLTGIVPFEHLNVSDPLSKAVEAEGRGAGWLDEALGISAVVGLFSTVLVTFYGQTRILMRMSADGMLPPIFNRVDKRFKTPAFTTILCGIAGAAVAGARADRRARPAGLDRHAAGIHDRLHRSAGAAAHPPADRAPLPGAAREPDRRARPGQRARADGDAADRHLDPPGDLARHRPDDLLQLLALAHEGGVRGAGGGGRRVGCPRPLELQQ